MLGFGTLTKKVFGTPNDRKIKSVRPLVEQINALESEFQAFTDDGLKDRTEELAKRAMSGEALDVLLPEAFANCREAAKRALGLRAYDTQLMGAIFLHQGNIAEQKTGEGKTLTATFAVYLNALTGKGVHVVTVNDYLVQRDAEWMGKVFAALGLTTGTAISGMSEEAKRAAYACDVTYATNNELGFDYLRDNMKPSIAEMVQRGHNYAIVDEVDSILVDEARTPLVISGHMQDRSELYVTIDAIIPLIEPEHYLLDEKQRNVTFTDEGNEFLEEQLRARGLIDPEVSLYDPESTTIVHHVNQGLRAHVLFKKDKDYIVRDNEVVLIDEFTGRMMAGRRLSDGLHQALEAKESVKIQPENQTLASVTFQNYFRLYDKLAGMTGTAATEAEEFAEIYGLEILPQLDNFSDNFAATHAGVAEIVVPPGSSVIGKTPGQIRFRATHGLSLLGIHRGEETLSHVETPDHAATRLTHVPLLAGDTLVVHTKWESLTRLSRNRDYVVVTSEYPREEVRPQKVSWALVFFGLAIAMILLTDIRLSLCLLTGAAGMIVSRVLSIDEAYEAVSWNTVFLLASLIPLGVAVQATGTAAWIAQQVLMLLEGWPIWGLQLGVAIMATVFTLVMSNVGATVLLVPLAVSIAVAAGGNPAIFALTVAISTSNSFLIPTHQVNALIMGPGGYRVIDFVRCGAGMTLLFLIVSMVVMHLLF